MAETPKYSFRRIEPSVGKLGQMERKHRDPVHTVQLFNYHLEKADRLQEKLGASLVGRGGGGKVPEGREAEGAVLKEEWEKGYIFSIFWRPTFL